MRVGGAAFAVVLCLVPALASAKATGWQQVAPAPVQARYGATVVALDGRFFVLGGHPGMRCPDEGDCAPTLVDFAVDAAQYDPAAGTWRPVASLPVPLLPTAAVVSGGVVYVLGSTPCVLEQLVPDVCPDPDAGWVVLAYEPRADHWTVLPAPPGSTAQLDGATMLDADGRVVTVLARRGSAVSAGAVFDPTDRIWRSLPKDPLLAARPKNDVQGLGAAWVAGRLLLTAGVDGERGPVRLAAFTVASGRWAEVRSARITAYNAPVAVGGRVVWPDGGVLDPRTGTYRALPGPLRAAAVTGLEVDARHPVPDGVVVGRDVTLNGYLFDPSSGRTTALPAAPAPADGAREPGFAAAEGAIFRFGGADGAAPSNAAYLLRVTP
jgi:hypothetical protein